MIGLLTDLLAKLLTDMVTKFLSHFFSLIIVLQRIYPFCQH